MIIPVIFKTPDAVTDSLKETQQEIDRDEENGIDAEEKRAELQKMETLFNKYVRWGECITVEFDTEKQIATVVGLHT